MTGGRWTEIVVGKVKILMRLDFIMAVKNDTECFYTQPAGCEAAVNNWIAKGQEAVEVELQSLLFNLNRLLYEQAKAIMEPVLDEAFVRPRGSEDMGQTAV